MNSPGYKSLPQNEQGWTPQLPCLHPTVYLPNSNPLKDKSDSDVSVLVNILSESAKSQILQFTQACSARAAHSICSESFCCRSGREQGWGRRGPELAALLSCVTPCQACSATQKQREPPSSPHQAEDASGNLHTGFSSLPGAVHVCHDEKPA